MSLTISLGHKVDTGKAEAIQPFDGVEDLSAALEQHTGIEAWWSPHVWKDNQRKKTAWLSASGVALDIDSDGHKALTDEEHSKLSAALEQAGATLYHNTPAGARAVFLFSEQNTDAAVQSNLTKRLAHLTTQALHDAGVDFAQVDGAAQDLGRLLYAPNAFAKKVQRQAEIEVFDAENSASAEQLLDALGDMDLVQEEAAAPVVTVQKTRGGSAFARAAQAFNDAHPIDFTTRTCPICGHNDCFGPLAVDENKWFCFSEDHNNNSTGEKGRHSGGGWWGDALDLEANKLGKNRAQVLIEVGLLQPYEQNDALRVSKPGDPWAKPQELVSKIAPQPYPLEALPETIRAAVEEVQGFVKAPLAMVASSALGAVSLTTQAHYDVARDAKLSGPTSLFLLVLGQSGERKSTVDRHFISAIEEYEAEERKKARQEEKEYEHRLGVWDLEVKKNAKSLQATKLKSDDKAQLKDEHRGLLLSKPEPPRIPRLIFLDVTPEELARSLSKNWPTGGIVTAEGGIVFGSHGMGKDSIMRNLSQLNALWSDEGLRIDRKTTENLMVKGVRLSISVQIQASVLRDFLEQAGTLARGSGFLARFLFSWPESTQGTRYYSNPPENTPALAAFNSRQSQLLQEAAPINEEGALEPRTLPLSKEAKNTWVSFHNSIEEELGPGGDLIDVADVASKAADNAARVAALFHVFEGAPSTAITEHTMINASKVVAWHLNEARRFFGEVAQPPDLADASSFENWLVKYARAHSTSRIPKSAAQKSGPNKLRSKEKMEKALTVLQSLDRARLEKGEGRAQFIALNPSVAAAVIEVIAVEDEKKESLTAKTAKTATASLGGNVYQ